MERGAYCTISKSRGYMYVFENKLYRKGTKRGTFIYLVPCSPSNSSPALSSDIFQSRVFRRPVANVLLDA